MSTRLFYLSLAFLSVWPNELFFLLCMAFLKNWYSQVTTLKNLGR